jgi:hypothetical protein
MGESNTKSTILHLETMKKEYERLMTQYKVVLSDINNSSDVSGSNVIINDSIYSSDSIISTDLSSNLSSCEAACSSNSTCTGATFLSNNTCTLYSSNGTLQDSQNNYAIVSTSELPILLDNINSQLNSLTFKMSNELMKGSFDYGANTEKSMDDFRKLRIEFGDLIQLNAEINENVEMMQKNIQSQIQTTTITNANYYYFILLVCIFIFILYIFMKVTTVNNDTNTANLNNNNLITYFIICIVIMLFLGIFFYLDFFKLIFNYIINSPFFTKISQIFQSFVNFILSLAPSTSY